MRTMHSLINTVGKSYTFVIAQKRSKCWCSC